MKNLRLAPTGIGLAVALPAMSDVSIIVAEVNRLPLIREGLQLPGRMMHFTSFMHRV